MVRLSALSVVVLVHCQWSVVSVRGKGRYRTPQARWANVTFVKGEESLTISAKNVMGEEKLHAMFVTERGNLS